MSWACVCVWLCVVVVGSFVHWLVGWSQDECFACRYLSLSLFFSLVCVCVCVCVHTPVNRLGIGLFLLWCCWCIDLSADCTGYTLHPPIHTLIQLPIITTKNNNNSTIFSLVLQIIPTNNIYIYTNSIEHNGIDDMASASSISMIYMLMMMMMHFVIYKHTHTQYFISPRHSSIPSFGFTFYSL